jgi:Spy/CpxP family protein refolding chaperone
MQNSKQLAVMFLLGAFLVGGAFGFTADRVWGRDSTCRDPRSSRALLYDRLELTTDQRAAWDAILDDRHDQYQVLLKPLRPQMDSVRLRARAQMRTLLTPEQRERFEDILREPKPNDRRENSK